MTASVEGRGRPCTMVSVLADQTAHCKGPTEISKWVSRDALYDMQTPLFPLCCIFKTVSSTFLLRCLATRLSRLLLRCCMTKVSDVVEKLGSRGESGVAACATKI